MGDRQWKTLLDRHDEVSGSVTLRHGGEVVKSTGDGVLSIFSSTSSAIGAARDITHANSRESTYPSVSGSTPARSIAVEVTSPGLP